MKLVVVDPVDNYAASKADEWVPIRPGTDSAFGLGLLYVLLHELGIYDAEFLRHKTNAPYLVGADGLYLRDPATGKPLLYDQADDQVKPHDDPSLKTLALEGQYRVDGAQASPSFVALKEAVRDYPPDRVAEITTIPATTLRKIAREFGEAAQVGATRVMDGQVIPYRPVCLDWGRGPQGHKHGFHHGWALKLVNIIVGAVGVPGGILSTGAAGKNPFTWWPEGGKDGMLEHGGIMLGTPPPFIPW
jgi:molybdopterin-containing oxidoreductase family molybdopterin binding subunit